MPELPEVEIVVRELRRFILAKTISNSVSHWHKTIRNLSSSDLAGQRVNEIGRTGKYILVRLSKTYLVVHLRMTGQLLFLQTGQVAPRENHIRAEIFFTDGSRLIFKDLRKFGRICHVDDPEPVIRAVGLDALSEDLNQPVFEQMLKNSRMNIKSFLLYQKYVAGLGNIYIDESLFRAGIHPVTPAECISNKHAANLLEIMREVLQSAISNMGSTISDYRDVNGNAGNNQHFFKVYGRAGQTCSKCTASIEKIKLAGRGTHFCPYCQKILIQE